MDLDFFELLWPVARDEQLVLSAFRPQTKGSGPVEIRRERIGAPVPSLTPDLDWYFGVASRDPKLAVGLGTAQSCRSTSCFFVDIDVRAPGHHAANLPPEDQVADLLAEAQVPEPSAIVHTGGGWHVYWFLDRPVDVHESNWRDRLFRFNRRIARTWEREGLHLDNTAKVTQILRVPGTQNWKTGSPRNVHLLFAEDLRYPLSAFEFERGRPKKSSSEARVGPRKLSAPPSPASTSGVRRRKPVSEDVFFERLKEQLLSGPHAEEFELVYAGKRFAEVERDNTLQRLASRLAFAGRRLSHQHATVEKLAPLFEETMRSYVDEEWTFEENMQWAEDKISRALCDADLKITEEEERDDRLWAFFERATADDPNIVFRKGDAQELGSWLAKQDPPKVFAHGSIYEYEGDAWIERPREIMYTLIGDEFAERMVQREGTTAKGEPFQPKEIMLEQNKVQGIYAQLCAYAAKPNYFEDAPHGYAFTNGVLQVTSDKTLELVPHNRDNRNIGKPFLTYIEDPTPRLEPWFEYLDGLRLLEDEQTFLHEFIGIALLGLSPRYKKCLALLGGGDNGKSMFMGFVASLFQENRTTQISPHRWGTRFGTFGLRNSLLNYVEEIPNARIEASSAFKQIVGGGRTSTDVKHGSEFSFIPRAAHIFAFNELPYEAADLSEGWWSRWILIPFRRHFERHERNPKHYEEVLAPMRDAVASYCLQQAEWVLQNGYTISHDLSAKVAEWRFRSDPVQLFIATKLEPDASAKQTSEELYMNYMHWCRTSRQVRPVPQDAFTNGLTAAGYKPTDALQPRWPVRVRQFAGIALANGHHPSTVTPPK